MRFAEFACSASVLRAWFDLLKFFAASACRTQSQVLPKKVAVNLKLLTIIHLEMLPLCMCMEILIEFVPKQQEYSLRKSLEVVVAINGWAILHCNLPEHLNHRQHISTSQINIPASRFCTGVGFCTCRSYQVCHTQSLLHSAVIFDQNTNMFLTCIPITA